VNEGQSLLLTIADTNQHDVMNYADDSLIEQIWHDLDGQVARERIRQVAAEIAAEFHTATVTAFVPIFIRRRAREKLEIQVNENQDFALDG
jgi:hypothetical protein